MAVWHASSFCSSRRPVEDPDEGAHQDFLEVITEAADEVRIFRSLDASDQIVDYLNAWAP